MLFNYVKKKYKNKSKKNSKFLWYRKKFSVWTDYLDTWPKKKISVDTAYVQCQCDIVEHRHSSNKLRYVLYCYCNAVIVEELICVNVSSEKNEWMESNFLPIKDIPSPLN